MELGSTNLSRIWETQIPPSPWFKYLSPFYRFSKTLLTISLLSILLQSSQWSFSPVHDASSSEAQRIVPGVTITRGFSFALVSKKGGPVLLLPMRTWLSNREIQTGMGMAWGRNPKQHCPQYGCTSEWKQPGGQSLTEPRLKQPQSA